MAFLKGHKPFLLETHCPNPPTVQNLPTFPYHVRTTEGLFPDTCESNFYIEDATYCPKVDFKFLIIVHFGLTKAPSGRHWADERL